MNGDGEVDVVLAGAGLASSLIAVAIAQAAPGIRMLMLDERPGPGERHTWSFHEPDVSASWLRRLQPALKARWSGQEVRFADHSRVLRAGYASLDDAGLANLVATTAPGLRMRWNTRVLDAQADGVTLAGGARISAPCVLDGRGANASDHVVCAWQKFVGIEIRTRRPHGVKRPVIMDATVPQDDGYRFVYSLPFSDDRILLEDTRYSDGAALDMEKVQAALSGFAQLAHGPFSLLRREHGALPIVLALDAEGLWRAAAGQAVPVGARGGFSHPVTGYTLPMAVQVADEVARVLTEAASASRRCSTGAVFQALRELALRRAHDDRFLRLLNRMLFHGCEPGQRVHVMSRFYRLSEPLIERFYANRLSPLDRLRIVSGKPPIGLGRALHCVREQPLLLAQQRNRAAATRPEERP